VQLGAAEAAAAAVALCCYVTPAQDLPGVVWLEENILPAVVLGALCDFPFRTSSLACLQTVYIKNLALKFLLSFPVLPTRFFHLISLVIN
jgi:hypothetical protein